MVYKGILSGTYTAIICYLICTVYDKPSHGYLIVSFDSGESGGSDCDGELYQCEQKLGNDDDDLSATLKKKWSNSVFPSWMMLAKKIVLKTLFESIPVAKHAPPDYDTVISSEEWKATFPDVDVPHSLCPPLDSCADRCEELTPSSNPHVFEPFGPYSLCNCDEMCEVYGDCCPDYDRVCKSRTLSQITGTNTTTDISDPKPLTSCFQISKNNTAPSILVFTECPSRWTNRTIREACQQQILDYEDKSRNASVTSSDNLVIDDEGRLFVNKYCGICNDGQKLTKVNITEIVSNIWKPTDEQEYAESTATNSDTVNGYNQETRTAYNAFIKLRKCQPSAIDSCKENRTNKHLLSKLCRGKYGGSVEAFNNDVYKNVYCALCNEESIVNLQCPLSAYQHSVAYSVSVEDVAQPTMQISDFGNDVDVGTASHRILITRNKIPASFSILLNFGLDGSERMMFSSEREEEMRKNRLKCGPNQLWDPFSKVCRRLYCSADFILVDFSCVKKQDRFDHSITHMGNETGVLAPTDTDSSLARITLGVEFLQQDHKYLERANITDLFYHSFIKKFHISENRIKDIKVSKDEEKVENNTEHKTQQPAKFLVDIQLDEPEKTNSHIEEPSIDNMVFQMTNWISETGSFDMKVGNVTGHVYSIHEDVDMLETWCVPEFGGRKIEYWNDEFTLIMNEDPDGEFDWVRELYINKTGKTYGKGEFAANILFQGLTNDHNQVNASGVVFVCEMEKRLNESCERIMLEKNEYDLIPNGSINFLGPSEVAQIIDLSEYEISHNGSILVCYKGKISLSTLAKFTYDFTFDKVQAYVSLVLLCISITALTMVLLTYVIFSNLRNLPGCNTMNLTVSLLAMQITFVVGQLQSVQEIYCRIVAILLHYEILVMFFWMSIMAFDLYRTFGNRTIVLHVRTKEKYLLPYMLYAYLGPIIIVGLAYMTDRWDNSISPKYGCDNVCWITRRNAALLFFALPLAIVLIVNVVFYVLTIRSVRKVQKTVRLKKSNLTGENDVVLYTRMAAMMGFTWIVSFAAAILRKPEWLGEVLTYIFIVFNTLQGLFIFFAFVCNKRVFSMYQTLFSRLREVRLKNCNKCNALLCVCKAKTIGRSQSTETTISIVSTDYSDAGTPSKCKK